MAVKKRAPQTAVDSKERARAATERARARLEGGESPAAEAWRTAPLSWWRERWHDKAIRRLFIENFIHVRSMKTEKGRLAEVQRHAGRPLAQAHG